MQRLRRMRTIHRIRDVVDWGLCVGCGACSYFCPKGAVRLTDIESLGIRPRFIDDICLNCNECLTICPGYSVNALSGANGNKSSCDHHPLVGRSLEVWEGHARDEELRHQASSGGVLSALAAYCLEKEGMSLVLHTGMHPTKPWANRTVVSRHRHDILSHCGSRYAPASPCDSLASIEQSEKPCVFIGKPCDAAAVSLLRRKRPALDEKLGLVLTFFCAGTPCTQGTLDLVKRLAIPLEEVRHIRYRGNGWPGAFTVRYGSDGREKTLTYEESWGSLERYRKSFRCHLCPDGLGELADISCGDAWHRYPDEKDRGRSIVIVRTERGRETIRKAAQAGYLELDSSSAAEVVAAQGLVKRRSEIFGRLLAMKALCVPIPRFTGFELGRSWRDTVLAVKLRSILGTIKRLLVRGLWHKNPIADVHDDPRQRGPIP